MPRLALVLLFTLTACSGALSARLERPWGHSSSRYGSCSASDLNHDGVVGGPDFLALGKQKPPATEQQMANLSHWFGQTCDS